MLYATPQAGCLRGACQAVDVVKGSRTRWNHLAWTARSTLGHLPMWTAETARHCRHSQTTQAQPGHSDPVRPLSPCYDPIRPCRHSYDTVRPFRHSYNPVRPFRPSYNPARPFRLSYDPVRPCRHSQKIQKQL